MTYWWSQTSFFYQGLFLEVVWGVGGMEDEDMHACIYCFPGTTVCLAPASGVIFNLNTTVRLHAGTNETSIALLFLGDQ